MEQNFHTVITPDGMSAYLELTEQLSDDFSITSSSVISFLANNKIVYGINDYVVNKLCTEPDKVSFPVIIAKGIPAKDGEDAHLINEVKNNDEVKGEKINFRNVLKIPSVKSGQLIASVVPATMGSEGKDVTGKRLPAKVGRPLKIRPGKNVIFNVSQFYSTADGELSVTDRQISVNPVFEVKGDLDLKVGNIDFIGNVTINGNVPSGYEIRSGGDVKINGLVEAANIFADGNIIITGGITGANKGKIVAKGNIQANFLNQANIYSGQNIYIQKSILHSRVEATGNVYCNQGMVIGGETIAGQDVHVKEIGSKTYMKTEIRAGYDKMLMEKEQELLNQKNQINENLQKLVLLEQQIQKIEQVTGKLTEEQKIVLLKQRSTKGIMQQQLENIEEELFHMEIERKDKPNPKVYVYDRVHPNVSIQFGKYFKQIQIVHQRCSFFFKSGEICFEPLI